MKWGYIGEQVKDEENQICEGFPVWEGPKGRSRLTQKQFWKHERRKTEVLIFVQAREVCEGHEDTVK